MTRSSDATDAARAFDARRRDVFLEKADTDLADAEVAQLRHLDDAALGLDAACFDAVRRAHALPPEATFRRHDAQGTFHRLYDVDGLAIGRPLLRVCTRHGIDGVTQMALETRVMAHVRDHGVPVPHAETQPVVLGTDARGTQLIARMPGTPMRAVDDDEPTLCAALEALTCRLRHVHALRGQGFGPVAASAPAWLTGVHADWLRFVTTRLDEHLAICADAGLIDQVVSDRIAGEVARVATWADVVPSALLHGDPGSHNVLIEGGTVTALLDWEDALLGDPLFELASLCNFHPERRHPIVFAAYPVDLSPQRPEYTRFWVYFLRIAIARTVHRLRFGYADVAGRPPAAHRIRLALARLDEAGAAA